MESLKKYATLMPVPCSEKRPMFPHAGDQWTQRKYFEFEQTGKAHELCALLYNLVVVDVDSFQLADKWEVLFPELVCAPCDKTPRGRHYWFRRSQYCDRFGYFDGAGQKVPMIDFKSITSKGTAGKIYPNP